MDLVNYEPLSQEQLRQIEEDARAMRAEAIAEIFSNIKARLFGTKAAVIPAE